MKTQVKFKLKLGKLMPGENFKTKWGKCMWKINELTYRRRV